MSVLNIVHGGWMPMFTVPKIISQCKNTLQAPVKSLWLRIACDQVHILMSNVPFRTVARLELGQCHLGCLNFNIMDYLKPNSKTLVGQASQFTLRECIEMT